MASIGFPLQLLFIFFFAAFGFAQTKSTITATTATRSEPALTCITVNCHATMSKGAFVHAPLKDGVCQDCHDVMQEPADKKTKHPGNVTITLVQQGSQLCYRCHVAKNTAKVIHAPIISGDCISCHNPHQSQNKGLMKEPVPAICFRCHQDSMMKSKVMHAPVKDGKCSECHFNHQGDLPNRLVREGNDLCYACHKKQEEGVTTKKDVHPPVKQSCILCHNAHGTASNALMSSPSPEICATCHPTEVALLDKSLNRHSPMSDAKGCLNCHDPHFADQPKLLPLGQQDLCLSCHDKEMTTEMGTVKDLKAFLAANKGGAGPLKNKECSACHNPHGSDYWRLLVKYYTSNFYTSYSDSKYAMCFTCHDKSGFTTMYTHKATNFRDGDRNLHFVHVNKLGKGRTCRACHDACASCQSSGLSKGMKETVGFSYWTMPMNYTPSKDGGTCAPGCHGEKMYRR